MSIRRRLQLVSYQVCKEILPDTDKWPRAQSVWLVELLIEILSPIVLPLALFLFD